MFENQWNLRKPHETIENCENLKQLKELWINNNKISSFDDIRYLSACCPLIDTIYLEHNIIQTLKDINDTNIIAVEEGFKTLKSFVPINLKNSNFYIILRATIFNTL